MLTQLIALAVTSNNAVADLSCCTQSRGSLHTITHDLSIWLDCITGLYYSLHTSHGQTSVYLCMLLVTWHRYYRLHSVRLLLYIDYMCFCCAIIFNKLCFSQLTRHSSIALRKSI